MFHIKEAADYSLNYLEFPDLPGKKLGVKLNTLGYLEVYPTLVFILKLFKWKPHPHTD